MMVKVLLYAYCIELGLSPDRSRQINHMSAGRSFGEGQAQAQQNAQPTRTEARRMSV
jgi:hypothetical protein